MPALRPDVALLHAPAGDRYGNLHLEQPYVLDERFAAASAMVVATVDELVSTDDVVASGVTIPAHLVAAVAEVLFGAHPVLLPASTRMTVTTCANTCPAAQAGGRTWQIPGPPTSMAAREGDRRRRSAPAGSPR